MDKTNKNTQTEPVREMPKQSPQSSCLTPSTIPRSHYQQQIASPYGLASTRENRSSRESLLINRLRASNSLPFGSRSVTPSRTRRLVSPGSFPVVQKLEVGDDDVVVMDGVLVASATGKIMPKPSSDSGPVSVGGPAHSLGSRNTLKNAENCSVRSEIGCSQETVHSHQSAAGKGETQVIRPYTTGYNSEANSLESFVSARPFTPTLRSPFGQQFVRSHSHMMTLPSETYALTRPAADIFHTPPPSLATGFSILTINQRLTGNNKTPISRKRRDTLPLSPTSTWTPTSKCESQLPPTPASTEPQISNPTNASKTLPHTPTSTPRTEESSTKITSVPSHDWLPQDDCIETILPFQSEKSVSWKDMFIQDALFNPFKYSKRLPVFFEICSDDTLPDSTKSPEHEEKNK